MAQTSPDVNNEGKIKNIIYIFLPEFSRFFGRLFKNAQKFSRNILKTLDFSLNKF